MITKKARRVVIINDINSSMIEQAIFILKGNSLDKNVPIKGDIVTEAQNIINYYINNVEKNSFGLLPKKDNKAFLKHTIKVVVSVCVMLAAVCILAKVF